MDADSVFKSYVPGRNIRKRFLNEKRSLERLSGLDGVPVILECDESMPSLTLKRIEGIDLDACTDIPDSFFEHLHVLIEQMLDRGVARHTLRARDMLCRPDGTAALLDYEKITLRSFRFSPVWKAACAVTRFNYLRLLKELAPHLLTTAQARRLALQESLRNIRRPFSMLRSRFK